MSRHTFRLGEYSSHTGEHNALAAVALGGEVSAALMAAGNAGGGGHATGGGGVSCDGWGKGRTPDTPRSPGATRGWAFCRLAGGASRSTLGAAVESVSHEAGIDPRHKAYEGSTFPLVGFRGYGFSRFIVGCAPHT